MSRWGREGAGVGIWEGLQGLTQIVYDSWRWDLGQGVDGWKGENRS